MKKLIRVEELDLIYHRIIGRQDLELIAASGAGKSYLIQRLIEKLEGRRVCFRLDLQASFQIAQLLHLLALEIDHLSDKHPNLAFQLKRFEKENPSYLVDSLVSFAKHLLKLRDHLSQVGLDFLFIFENPENWDFTEDFSAFHQEIEDLNNSPNLQVLIASTADLNVYPQFKLKDLALSDIWSENESWQGPLFSYCRGNLAFIKAFLPFHKNSESTRDFFKSLSSSYLLLKNRCTILQWKLLRSIATYEMVKQPHAFDFLVKHQLGAASSVERALRNLVDSQLVERGPEGYRVSSPQLHRWLQFIYTGKSFN